MITLTLHTPAEVHAVRRGLLLYRRQQALGVMAPCDAAAVLERLAAAERAEVPDPPPAGKVAGYVSQGNPA